MPPTLFLLLIVFYHKTLLYDEATKKTKRIIREIIDGKFLTINLICYIFNICLCLCKNNLLCFNGYPK